jgi:hypothetical protein
MKRPFNWRWRLTEHIELGEGNLLTSTRLFKSSQALARHIGCSVWTIQRWRRGLTKYRLLDRYELEEVNIPSNEISSVEGSNAVVRPVSSSPVTAEALRTLETTSPDAAATTEAVVPP